MWSFFSRDPSKDFNFEIGELVPSLDNKSVWGLHKGKKKVRSYFRKIFKSCQYERNQRMSFGFCRIYFSYTCTKGTPLT